MDESAANLEDLITQTRALQRQSAHDGDLSRLLGRVEPILSHVNNFAAVIALYSGTDPTATGLVWGSLHYLLDLSRSAKDAFRDILDMLDELSLSLPRFRVYEETLPMNKDLETALVDVYSEMICFYARTIRYFEKNPHGRHCFASRHSGSSGPVLTR